MKATIKFIGCLLICLIGTNGMAQTSTQQDPSLNNLEHAAGYLTDPSPSLGSFKKVGKGEKDMVLIPGLGFSENIFDDFMEANKNEFSMIAVTLAGFGDTKGLPMPEKDNAPYGKMAWTEVAKSDILKLINTEKLDKPILVGHFLNGTQIAFDLAREHPELIGGVIILGGEPYRYFASRSDTSKAMSFQERQGAVDYYFGPQWFKTVTKKTWDDNMFLPEYYTTNKNLAQNIWDESAAVPVPVMVRYLCEFFSYDMTRNIADLKVPSLVLIPSFSPEMLVGQFGSFVKLFFIDIWDSVKEKNKSIRFETIENARLFVWEDQPEKTYKLIKGFAKGL